LDFYKKPENISIENIIFAKMQKIFEKVLTKKIF